MPDVSYDPPVKAKPTINLASAEGNDEELALIEADQGGGEQSWDYPGAVDMRPLSPRWRPAGPADA
jgi:hypothetical protein